jgi:two-component sensor histidine kinase
MAGRATRTRTGAGAPGSAPARQRSQIKDTGRRMSSSHVGASRPELLDTPDLAGALESDRFKRFLDHIPVAVAVSELQGDERITYANLEFERLTQRPAPEIFGKPWRILVDIEAADVGDEQLSDAIIARDEYIGRFVVGPDGRGPVVDAWSNVIEDNEGMPMFRLVALAEAAEPRPADQAELERKIREKDTLLRELQHRVKNNLQLITTLIRLEARNMPDHAAGERFDRLVGRIESLALLYRSMSESESGESIDLGVYLSQIASAVMRAHAVEGIRLDLKVDTWPVSVNVAMPAGLVVNELLINALKHAFVGRDGGTITLQSLVDETGCRVIVADDGVGLDEGTQWPRAGKLSALIVLSLEQNAGARVEVRSAPNEGLRVTILFSRADAAPDA